MKKAGNKVWVGLSGGVDSAVSAALLQKQGFDVTGVFIKAWNPPGFVCTWKEDRRSAMRVAAVLDIPLITLDLEKEYKKEVVDYMIQEYQAGNTPNPDVMCNKEIKFGHFLKFALENGADFVATGHYAKVVNSQQITDNSKNKKVNDYNLSSTIYNLCEATDKEKDQSYFLWTLTKEQLKHVLFPIGHLEKREVRKLAERFKLPQATRKDSQGLCFLGKIDMKEFLGEYLETKKGKVLNTLGEVIGEHDGALLYTIGERHGFRVSNRETESEPMYVVKKDIEKNTITVAGKKKSSQKVLGSPRFARPDIFSRTFSSQPEKLSFGLGDINWTGDEELKSKEITCRIRYRTSKIKCRFEGDVVTFDEPPFGISPGQSLVFYDREVCLGGGVIQKVIV